MTDEAMRREGFGWYWGEDAPMSRQLPQVAQVGGDHYAGDLQHWDLCEMFDVAYLEGNATAYVARWRRKNGRQDLEKALSYLEKMGDRPTRRTVRSKVLAAWYVVANIDPADAHLIGLVLADGYGQPAHVELVKAELRDMIAARSDAPAA